MRVFRLPAWIVASVLVLSCSTGSAAEPIPLHQALPYPMPSQVYDGINSWLWLCYRVGVDPGLQTNLASVDWEHSFAYTNSAWSQTVQTVQVHFTNGVIFEAYGRFAISHYAADAAFSVNSQDRPQAERNRFYGTVKKDWRQLATGLERRLVQELRVPPEVLRQFSMEASSPEMGSYAFKRLVVDWRRVGSPRLVHGRPTMAALTAEFDLGTGELKSIAFQAPELINATARHQTDKREL